VELALELELERLLEIRVGSEFEETIIHEFFFTLRGFLRTIKSGGMFSRFVF